MTKQQLLEALADPSLPGDMEVRVADGLSLHGTAEIRNVAIWEDIRVAWYDDERRKEKRTDAIVLS